MLCNAFQNHKQALLDAGELSPRMWKNHWEVAELPHEQVGKGRLVADLAPDDFAALRRAMSKTWGAVRVRSVFKHGYDDELLLAPMHFGPGFTRPTKKTVRLARTEKGQQMFEPAEVRALVEGARVAGESGPREVRGVCRSGR